MQTSEGNQNINQDQDARDQAQQGPSQGQYQGYRRPSKIEPYQQKIPDQMHPQQQVSYQQGTYVQGIKEGSNQQQQQQFQLQQYQNHNQNKGYNQHQHQPIQYIGQPQQMVVIQQQVIMIAPKSVGFHANFMSHPTEIICPRCKQSTITIIHHEYGAGTYAMSFILFLQFALLFCWLPFLFKKCQDVVHVCNHCQGEVGINPYTIC